MIITKDRDGCEYFDRDKRVVVPGYSVKCRWKYGAGAVFSSVFLWSELQAAELAESLTFAIVVASTYISSESKGLCDARYLSSTCNSIKPFVKQSNWEVQ